MMDKEKGFWSRVYSFGRRWDFLAISIFLVISGVLNLKDENDYQELELSILGAVIFLILFFVFSYPEIKYDRLNKKLKKTGIKTTAEILSVKQTGKYVNEMPYFRLELKYSVHGQEVIKKKFDVLVSYPELGYYSPGSSLELLVDPDNVQNVVFA